MCTIYRTISCLLAAVSVSASAAALEDYIDDQTLLVASLDLKEVASSESVATLLTALGPAKAPGEMALGGARELRNLGATQVGVVFGIDDVRSDYGPVVVVSFDNADGMPATTTKLEAMLNGAIPDAAVRTGGANTLLVGNAKAVDRYDRLAPAPRPDLLEPLAAADATLAVVVSPGADARRVLRELWPTLPAPFDKLSGPLVADEVQHTVVTVRLADSPGVTLSIAAPDESARVAVADALQSALQVGVDWVRANQTLYAGAATSVAELLNPKVDSGAVTVRLSGDEPALRQVLSHVLAPAVGVAQERALVSQKMNDMKQLALAMHNFYDRQKFFPANTAIVDKDGSPLLSWRVAILPYLEQQVIYDQFHLDEPWDSPHNLELAKRLSPDVFCRGNDQGMTTYLRPVYDGSDLAATRGEIAPVERKLAGQSCFLRPGDEYGDVVDGISNTVHIAEVAPEHAVFWTKPADWEVELTDPLAKLRTNKREGFVSAYWDGHAKYETFDVDPVLLKKLITKQGRDAVER